jgi:hypothetical protein
MSGLVAESEKPVRSSPHDQVEDLDYESRFELILATLLGIVE